MEPKPIDKILQYLFYIALFIFAASAIYGILVSIYIKVSGNIVHFLYGYKGTISFWSFIACILIAFLSNQVERIRGKRYN